MNAAIFTTALLLATVPMDDGVLRDRVCCIEIQHYCDDEAHEVFCQAIFWELHNGQERVIDWRLVKNITDRGANIKPQRDYRTGDYVARWMDGETFREVRALCVRERWSQADSELTDRQHHPQDRRRKLSSGNVPELSSVPERRWTE